MPDDSADEARTWRPMDIAALATRLGVVTALGFGYWHAAAMCAVRRLGNIHNAPHVAASANVTPNSHELVVALLGVTVAILIHVAGSHSRSNTNRVGWIVAPLVLIGELAIVVPLLGWWALLLILGGASVVVAVIVALVRLVPIEFPRSKDARHPERDRFNTVALLAISMVAGLLVAVGLILIPAAEQPVVLPELGKVVILRSDSVGHFALDDDRQLMWLSRSKVDMILVVPKTDDGATSENPESSGVDDSGPADTQQPE